MDIVMTTESDVAVFSIIGHLDAVSSPELEGRLGTWFEEPGTRLVLDLNGLEYISSAGLRVILSAAKKMKARNGKLGLSRLQPRVREVFQVSGFSSIIPVFETLPAALDAVR
ncbi:MAG: STAS domain-containing protein [Acidobacteriota bacterium]|jgi:anti-anti-sigma factor|nr:STAS domain-containing protein [Acidobacteriota bacterium]OQB58885.1 MAG: putative anti-sigma factor antagonist BtrV [Candidatus Aminicenantes bacterium ADurb.Bin147]HNQ80887.1 STAS domain-containing protein [Candidatus Aminicenantes bacterium]MDD8009996.1 STAS domain-containing protein [Acidobacteriota bacterium]MDD8029224.1 STAS domain-containing protein [Acidobacteriota bacterium]